MIGSFTGSSRYKRLTAHKLFTIHFVMKLAICSALDTKPQVVLGGLPLADGGEYLKKSFEKVSCSFNFLFLIKPCLRLCIRDSNCDTR